MRNEEKIHQLSEEAKKLLKMVFNSSKKEVRYADSGPEPIISIRGKTLEPVDEIKVALRELVRADLLREKGLWSATFFKAKDATVFRVTVDGSEAGRELAKIAKLTEQMDKMIEQAKEHLDADEDVIAAVIGRYERERHGVDDSIRTAIFVATVDRVVLHCKRWLGYELEVFPYSNISSIEMGKGFLGHSITLFASNKHSTYEMD